jgi:hypothetical protein
LQKIKLTPACHLLFSWIHGLRSSTGDGGCISVCPSLSRDLRLILRVSDLFLALALLLCSSITDKENKTHVMKIPHCTINFLYRQIMRIHIMKHRFTLFIQYKPAAQWKSYMHVYNKGKKTYRINEESPMHSNFVFVYIGKSWLHIMKHGFTLFIQSKPAQRK